MSTQIKITVDDELAERFKRAVIEKHGKLELSKEGAEALRLYLLEYHRPRRGRRDPLLDAIGMFKGRKGEKYDALKDKKALYTEG
jgi:hypothetical protein